MDPHLAAGWGPSLYRCRFVSALRHSHRCPEMYLLYAWLWEMNILNQVSTSGWHWHPVVRPWCNNILPAASECFSMLPYISPLQCKVGALFTPLLPLTQMQEKDLPLMLNSVEPPSMLQPQPKLHAKSQPQTRPSSNSLNNGATL